MVKIIQDPESLSLENRFAIVHTPRQSRKRFAESCITLHEDEITALKAANPEKNRYAAVVYGPSVSSESQKIYYLVKWL